ncbi:unnamed protein product [Aureobasidium mustum]|uniref:RBR-type E3 ubiquitin transferase n=1 Tax=Aureobasidium mustum TaxID=2773714 RepID=A0A9N8PGB4_9PEZI|nr:unnamed protein product [Aureobasidium mustum]
MDVEEHQHMLFAHAGARATPIETTQHHLPPENTTDATSNHVRICAVCFKDQSLEYFPDVSNDSRHQHGANTCRTCFNRYLIQQINAGQARVGCAECQEPLRYAEVKSIVAKTTLMKHDKNLLKAFVEEDADFYYCHCMACEIPWHEGETCDQYQARHDEEIIQTQVMVRQTSKICPGGCGARIERNGGCPHMLCSRCSHEFCYLCLGEWQPHLATGGCVIPIPATPEPDPVPAEIEWRQNERQARQNLRDFHNEQAEALIETITMPCPKCKVRIEKDGGCDHMTCVQCQYEFCYQCSANYATILRYDNRRHKRSCVYYSGKAHGRVMPLKTNNVVDQPDEPSTTAPTKRRRVTVRKPTVKNKKGGVTKKKAAVASTVVRRGTRTGLRSSTAAVKGPVTRSQTRARK